MASFTHFLTAKMSSKILQIHVQTSKITKTSYNNDKVTTPHISYSYSFNTKQHRLLHEFLHVNARPRSRTLYVSTLCSLSSPKPPTTKEEAINQAKISLSSALEKPLNNPKLAGKIKKLKQPRLRVEIPIIDDSASSLSALAVEVFGRINIKRKGSSQIKIHILWPSQSLTEAAVRGFESHSSDIIVQNISASSVLNEDIRTLNSADVVVFLAPEASKLAIMKRVTDSLYPKPVVIFNPQWSYEEEESFGEMSGFVGSFEVVYSFTGLEVRGILSKRKGVIFKCVRDGVLSGEKWNVLVEEGGELRVVSMFKTRPTIVEVENVLYNLMAVNSPVTKSAKFLKDLVSNVTGSGRKK